MATKVLEIDLEHGHGIVLCFCGLHLNVSFETEKDCLDHAKLCPCCSHFRGCEVTNLITFTINKLKSYKMDQEKQKVSQSAAPELSDIMKELREIKQYLSELKSQPNESKEV